MTAKNLKSKGTIDMAMIASVAAFVVVFVNKDSLMPAIAGSLLVALAGVVGYIGFKREAGREAELDEVELAAESFGARSGVAVVILVTFLLLALPPLQNAIAGLVDLEGVPENTPMPVTVAFFAAGLVSAMLLQLTSTFVLTRI